MNALSLYNRDVHSHPMLSDEEQPTVARRFAKDRDPRDSQRLVVSNLRLVMAMARSLGGAHRSDLMDLIQGAPSTASILPAA